jgi:low density lipoprotein receptor-related protein 5/6
MIYSQKNLTVRLLPSPTGCLEAVLPIQGLKGVKAIDFDPVQKFLYWVRINDVVVGHI